MDLRAVYFPKNNVLVTGATGFIGQAIASSLGDDMVRICDFEFIPRECTVIHCAASVKGDSESFLRNFEIDNTVFSLAIEKKLRVVYCSSNNVYPFSRDCGIGTSLHANDLYSLSKMVGEQLLCNIVKVPSVVVRIGDVFGIGQRHGNFFRSIETSLIQRKPLRLYGAGLKVRNYIHVAELAKLLIHLASQLKSREYGSEVMNGAYGEPVSVKDIVQHVHKRTGLPVELVDVPNDRSNYDLRTMAPTHVDDYTPLFEGFWKALDFYIDSCNKDA